MDVTDSIVFSDNTNAGTATASASYDGDTNHSGNTGFANFTIDKATSTVSVTCPDGPYTYTGSALTPACTATATGAGGLSVDVTDSIVFTDNTNAGTATASASYDGDTNHSGNTGFANFTINKATSTVSVTCPDGPYTYTGSALTPACTATATGAGGLSVDVTDSIVFSDNTNAGTATASAELRR